MLFKHRRSASRLVTTAAASVLLVILTACSGASDSDASKKPATLVVAITEDVDTFDVLSTTTSVTRALVGANVADTLAIFDLESKELNPSLATSWEQTDDTTWSLEIRAGVKFSDGSDLTTEDVAASINYGSDNDSPFYQTFYSTADKAVAVDESRVEVETSVDDPVFFRRLQYISVLPQDQLDADKLKDNLIGSGPYKLVKWDQGRSIKLTENENYWGDKKPEFKNVEFIIRPEASVRMDALKTNEAQLALLLDIERADSAPKSVSIPGQEVAGFLFNTVGQTNGSIMTDVKVRQAVNYAIDRKAVAAKLFDGKADLPNGQMNTSAMTGTDSGLKDYAYDPAKAKALLKEAGKDGATIRIRTNYTRWQRSKELTEAVAGYLTAVGLKPEINAVDFVTWQGTQTANTEGKDAPFDMLVLYHGNEYFDSSMKSVFNMRSVDAGHGNWLIGNDEIDGLANEVIEEADPDARNTKMRAIWKIFRDEALALPIVVPEFVTGMNKHLEYQPRSDEVLYLTDVTWKP